MQKQLLKVCLITIIMSSCQQLFGQEVYISGLEAPYSKAEIDSASGLLLKNNNSAFEFFKKNQQAIDSTMGKNYTHDRLFLAVYKKEVKPYTTDDKAQPDWKNIRSNLKPYGDLGNEIFIRSKAVFDYNQKNWIEFAKNADIIIWKYPGGVFGNNPTFAGKVNDFAWTVFSYVNDRATLKKALKWSKLTITGEDSLLIPNHLDTYANLLYKLGKQKKAVIEEKRAVGLAKKLKDEDLKNFEGTLVKMEAGLPTW